MENIDDIYNQALLMLKQGRSKQEVLVKFERFKNELAPLLELSESLFFIPKNIVPTPLMQRKYALRAKKTFVLAWTHFTKLAAVGMSTLLIISAFAATAYAALGALPGHTLFAVKKIEEQAQLAVTFNQAQKANLEVAFAQQRLNEAQQIFNNPSQSNTQEQMAALSELSNQTSSAVAAVNSVAQSDPSSQGNPPLINSLETLTTQQQNLLKQIKPGGQIQTAANSALAALTQSSDQISHIKQTVAVLGSDQGLISLNATSSAVAVLGAVTQISANQITIEKTAFSINAQTIITDTNGNSLTPANFSVGDRANVVGKQNQNALIAQTILLTEAAATAEETTTTPATSTIATTKSVAPTSTSASLNDDFTGAVTSGSATATASFILEDPNPQYNP